MQPCQHPRHQQTWRSWSQEGSEGWLADSLKVLLLCMMSQNGRRPALEVLGLNAPHGSIVGLQWRLSADTEHMEWIMGLITNIQGCLESHRRPTMHPAWPELVEDSEAGLMRRRADGLHSPTDLLPQMLLQVVQTLKSHHWIKRRSLLTSLSLLYCGPIKRKTLSTIIHPYAGELLLEAQWHRLCFWNIHLELPLRSQSTQYSIIKPAPRSDLGCCQHMTQYWLLTSDWTIHSKTERKRPACAEHCARTTECKLVLYVMCLCCYLQWRTFDLQ